MGRKTPFISFDERLSLLNDFILQLVQAYQAGRINSWNDLDWRVKKFFTPERMKRMEEVVPGWQKMATYADGITQTHVTCVFLGVFLLPEFQSLSPEGQQLAKWIVLFHDLDKIHLPMKRDAMHAFRSGILAANILPGLGFPKTDAYRELIGTWSELTYNAQLEGDVTPIPDNSKLPEILAGIDLMFGDNTPASVIVKTVLLHISLSIDPNYPTPAPLTDEEIRRFITPELYPFLKVMMMGDNEGWSLFDPQVRRQQQSDAIESFDRVHKLITSTQR